MKCKSHSAPQYRNACEGCFLAIRYLLRSHVAVAERGADHLRSRGQVHLADELSVESASESWMLRGASFLIPLVLGRKNGGIQRILNGVAIDGIASFEAKDHFLDVDVLCG